MTIFGRNLAWETRFRDAGRADDFLPVILPGSHVTVSVNGLAAPLEMASPEQVVFLMPPIMGAGNADVRLVHAGRAGPAVRIEIAQFAPALYLLQPGVALARHYDTYEWVTPASPAMPGQHVVLYATGLGPTRPAVEYRRIPRAYAEIAARRDFVVWLNDQPLPPEEVGYAGIMPGFPGIYEIHVRLPFQLPSNPRVTLQIGEHLSPDPVRLAVSGQDELAPEEVFGETGP